MMYAAIILSLDNYVVKAVSYWSVLLQECYRIADIATLLDVNLLQMKYEKFVTQ